MNDTIGSEPIQPVTLDSEERPRRRKKRPRKEPHWPWFLGGLVLGMVLFASLQWVYQRAVVDFGGGRNNGNGSTATTGGSANARGPADAPVTIVEFSDFRCGYCRRAYMTTNQEIMATYVDTGQVRFVYKHFAILGPESTQAAIASECAADQGKFWEYHDQLFIYQNNGGSISRDSLVQVAGQIGLDANRLATCLDNQETYARVQADMLEAQTYGFNGTPAYVVAGRPMVGAQPFEAFKPVIDAALNLQ